MSLFEFGALVSHGTVAGVKKRTGRLRRVPNTMIVLERPL